MSVEDFQSEAFFGMINSPQSVLSFIGNPTYFYFEILTSDEGRNETFCVPSKRIALPSL